MKHDTNIASLFPDPEVLPSDMNAQLLRTLPRAQLAKSYAMQLAHLAGPLLPRVQRVFGGAHAPVYLLTAATRRQVWNAVLAVRYPTGDMDALRCELMERKPRDLIEQAYDLFPSGFMTVLRKCGEFGLEPDFYAFWHQYVIDHPEDLPVLATRTMIGSKLKKALRELPPGLARLPVAAQVNNPEDLLRFVRAITHIHHGRPDPALWGELAKRIVNGEKPFTILTKIVDACLCPPPHITGDARFRHLSSIAELKAKGRVFQNCLGTALKLKQAVRGEHQYYEYIDSANPLVVEIVADTPFGYTVGDIRGPGNAYPDDALEMKVLKALAEHHILRRNGVLDIVEDWADRRSLGH